MGIPLRVLLVEDSPDDVLLALRELQRGGYEPEWERVDTSAAMAAALDRRRWDLVLCDYAMPHFSGPEALLMAHEHDIDLPIIILSGEIGEEVAVAAMKAGAHDYVMKGNLARLVPAVERELRETQIRRARRAAERDRAEGEERYRSLVSALSEGVVFCDAEGRIITCNASAGRILGLSVEEIQSRDSFDPRWETIHEDGSPFPGETHPIIVTLRTGEPQSNVVMGIRKGDGSRAWISINSQPLMQEGDTKPFAAVASVVDITEQKRTAEEIRRREAYFRSLIEHISDLITIADATGVIRYQSPSSERLLGYRPEEVLGSNAFDFLDPDDRASVARAFGAVFERPGVVGPVEVRVRHKDGSWRIFEGIGNNLLDDPVVGGFVVSSHDITARKREQEEKAALLEVARDISGTLDIGEILDRVQRRTAALLGCDRVATYYWEPSREAFRLRSEYGIPEHLREEAFAVDFYPGDSVVDRMLTGQTAIINDPSQQSLVPAELLRYFDINAIVATALVVRGRVMGAMTAVRSRPGHRFDPPEVDLFEGVARQVALAIGTAELHRGTEQEAIVSAALARMGQELISSLDQPVLLDRLCKLTAEVLQCDCSHTILWSPAERSYAIASGYGDSPEQWESMHVMRIPEALVSSLQSRLEQEEVVQFRPGPESLIPAGLMQQYGITRGIYLRLQRGNEVIGVQTAGYRGRTEPFSPAQVRIARGIAQLASLALANARLVEELERAGRLKSDFVATMSHELRTPLNVIMGYNELLLDRAYGPLGSEQVEPLERVRHNARELLSLINATLDVSRLEAGRVPVDRQELSVGDLLREIESEVVESPLKPDVRLVWKIPPDLPRIRTDPTKVRVVVKNLIGNAMKFTDRGSITITAAPRDGSVEIAVCDTGIGIAPEMMSAIFEPFRQVDSSSTRRHGGVGLGLYIVRRLLDVVGGKVEVESAPGEGATFRVWLPPD